MAAQSKRTTVILNSEDQELLDKITHRLRGSETESIRRAIRAFAYLLDVADEEGAAVIRRSDRADERLSFL